MKRCFSAFLFWVATTLPCRVFAQQIPSALPDLKLWLSADTGVTLIGSSVAVWNDISGNNLHCSQANAAERPAFTATNCLLNSKPSIYFDGTDDFLNGVVIPQLDSSSVTLFLIARGDAQPQSGINAGLLSINNFSNGFWLNRRLLNQTLGLANNGTFVAGTSSGPSSGFNFRVFTVVKTLNTDAYVYINSAQSVYSSNSIVTAPFTNANYLVGKGTGSGSGAFKGDIAEVIIYARALSNAERQQVLNYLYNKYAPPVNVGPAVVNEPYSFCKQLQADCGYTSYSWSTGAASASITVSNSGTYHLTTTDVFNRTSSDTITVSFPLVSLNIADTTICAGDSVLLIPVTPTGPYSFVWQNGVSSATFMANTSGVYFFSASDTNSCTKIAVSKAISIDSFSSTVWLGNDTTFCTGNQIALKSPVSWNGLTFNWSNGQSTPTAQINNSGHVAVTVTNSLGCVGKDTIFITIAGSAPSIQFSGDTLCKGKVYQHNATIVSTDTSAINTVLWNFGNGATSTNINPMYVYPVPGSYLVALFAQTTSGCSNTLQRTVLVKANPAAVLYADSACVNTPRLLFQYSTAPNPDSVVAWAWAFGDGGTASNAQPSHTYTSTGNKNVQLVVTSSNGCKDTANAVVSVKSTSANVSGFGTIAPLNGAVLTTNTVNFVWQPAMGAVKYALLLSQDSTMGTITTNNNILSASYSLVLNSASTYYYQVRAYSLCNDSITTAIVRFRVASPNIISNLALWLKADAGVSVTGGGVSQMTDFSGNNYHAVQTNPLVQPTYIASVPWLNNLPAIGFDGVNDSLIGPPISGLGDSSLTVMILAKGDTQPQLGQLAGMFTVNRADNGFWFARRLINQTFGVQTNGIFVSGATSSAPLNGFRFRVNQVIKRLNTDVALYINSNSSAQPYTFQPAIGAFINSTYQIGKSPTSTGTAFRGEIAEVLVYRKALSETERLLVLDYFYNKYAPPVDLGPDVVQTYSLCPVVLNASNRFVSYAWSEGSTSPAISVQQSGKYKVTVTDVFGRQSVDSVNVTFQTPKLTVTDTTICFGQTVLLGVQTTAPASLYSYLWSNAANTPLTAVNTSGQYFCIVTDTNNCSYNTPIANVNVNLFPTFTTLLPNDTNLCTGNIIGIATSGLPYSLTSVVWSTGAVGNTVPIINSGYYKMTATDAVGCKNRDSVLVTVKGIAPLVNFSATQVCIGDTTRFFDSTQIVAPDNFKSWNWSFGDFTSSALQNPFKKYTIPGSYSVTLTVMSDSGCQNAITKPVVVSAPPLANFTLPNVVCAGSSAKLTDISIGFFGDTVAQWSWYIGSDVLSGKSPQYIFPQQGTVAVTLVAATNAGCADTVIQFIEVFGALVPDFIYANTCAGSSTEFTDISTSLSVVDRLWNFGDMSPPTNPPVASHQYAAAGTYTVTLTVENAIGCKSSISKNITIADLPVANFTSLTTCKQQLYLPIDSSYSIADTIVSWAWNINGSYFSTKNPGYTFTETGNYPVSLKVINASGCADSASKIVSVKPLPVAAFAYQPLYGNAPLTVNFSNNSSLTNNYQWHFGDGDSSFVANPAHTYLQNDTFTITLVAISTFGCTDTSYKTIVVSPTALDLSISNVNSTIVSQGNGTALVQVSATLANIGTRIITSAQLFATIGSKGQLMETWNGLLYSGNTVNYVFTASFSISEEQTNSYVCVSARNVNSNETELRTDNNEECNSLTQSIQLIGPLPNPADAECTLGIVLPKPGMVQISIADMHGNWLEKNTTFNLPQGRTDYRIPSGNLNAGVYVVTVKYNDDKISKKFVIR